MEPISETIKKKADPFPEYHADDYGMFPVQSQRILACQEHGRLNGVSIMPNSPHLERCMEMLRPVGDAVAKTVHLNIMEGCSLAPAAEVPLLVDGNGVFRVGFGGLLLHSFLPGRSRYRRQLKQELKAQIFSVRQYLSPQEPLRLDGHAHYHMIPVVFDALMDVIREEKLPVSYIRIPREYPMLYLRHWKTLTDFSPINLVKVAILNILAWRNLRKYRDILENCEQKVFLGVMLSGRMYWENVAPILEDAKALARRKHWGLEILAHPGGVYEAEDVKMLTNRNDVVFLTNDLRNREASLFFEGKEEVAE